MTRLGYVWMQHRSLRNPKYFLVILINIKPFDCTKTKKQISLGTYIVTYYHSKAVKKTSKAVKKTSKAVKKVLNQKIIKINELIHGRQKL